MNIVRTRTARPYGKIFSTVNIRPFISHVLRFASRWIFTLHAMQDSSWGFHIIVTVEMLGMLVMLGMSGKLLVKLFDL